MAWSTDVTEEDCRVHVSTYSAVLVGTAYKKGRICKAKGACGS